MSLSKQKIKRRDRLWRENPNCFYCGRVTQKPNPFGGYNPPNACTLEHLYSRYNPKRYSLAKPNEERTVISCRACNEKMGREETLQQPIEELRARSQNGWRRKHVR